jgi:hypothetical protein
VGRHARDPGRSGTPLSILELVCRRCIDELDASDASVGLAGGDGLWAPAHSTGPVAADLEQQAFALGEGPHYDALRDHCPVLVGDVDRREPQARWPTWAPYAHAAGVRTVAALPIQAGAVAAGVLMVFAPELDWLDPSRLRLALRLADTALLGLLDLAAGLGGADGADSANGAHGPALAVDPALARPADMADVVRAEVHQAAGMIMAQADLPILAALARLRARAYQTGRPLDDLARDVLARRIRFSPDPDSAE